MKDTKIKAGWLTYLLIPMLLGGCIGEEHEPSPEDLLAPDDGAVGSMGPALDEGWPILGPPIDPWLPNETERILFEGEWNADACTMIGASESPNTRELFGSPNGCSAYRDSTEPLIPEGTARLRLEVDATAALKSGGFHGYLYTHVRNIWDTGDPKTSANGETSMDPIHTWVWELVPEEWDSVHWTRTQTELGLWPSGTGVTLLDGPIKVKIVAEKDPDWVAQAPLDHWRLPEYHHMPQDGAITVLNATLAWKQPGLMQGTPERPRFTDRVPVGTKTVVVGLSWSTIQGCAPIECRVWTNAMNRGTFLSGFGDAIQERGTTHLIVAWDAPDPFWTEPDHMAANQTELNVFATYICPGTSATCGLPVVTTETELRILAEAWRDPVDLEAFRARLGVA